MKKILVFALVLGLVLCGVSFAEANDAAYLEQIIGAEFPTGDALITAEQFNNVSCAYGVPVEGDELTLENATVAAVQIASLTEVAISYLNDDAPDKAAAVLERNGVAVSDEANAPYIACALDVGLIDASEELDAGITCDRAAELLVRAIEMAGEGRHYIGRISDADIQSKLYSVLKAFTIFENDQLDALGVELVLRGNSTGYNLKYAGYNANFLEDYTIKYGHSDITHAAQLVSLLKSEGFDGYIQIEPKVSVYEYMIDWGDPGEPTDTYAVLEVAEGRYLCYAVEYDMMIEFDTKEMKERFHEVIETYAKKYDDSFDADGNLTEKLIAGAWWQPLYTSTTEMENEEFGLLYDNVVYDETGMYSIHPFTVPEGCDALAAAVEEIAPELSVSPVAIYTNPAFMRYITGSDYQ